jgi:hypothetical protein
MTSAMKTPMYTWSAATRTAMPVLWSWAIRIADGMPMRATTSPTTR